MPPRQSSLIAARITLTLVGTGSAASPDRGLSSPLDPSNEGTGPRAGVKHAPTPDDVSPDVDCGVHDPSLGPARSRGAARDRGAPRTPPPAPCAPRAVVVRPLRRRVRGGGPSA